MAALNSLSHEVSLQVNQRVFLKHPALPHVPSFVRGVCKSGRSCWRQAASHDDGLNFAGTFASAPTVRLASLSD